MNLGIPRAADRKSPAVQRQNASKCRKPWSVSYPAYIGRQRANSVGIGSIAGSLQGQETAVTSRGGVDMDEPERKPLLVADFEERVVKTDEMEDRSRPSRWCKSGWSLRWPSVRRPWVEVCPVRRRA